MIPSNEYTFAIVFPHHTTLVMYQFVDDKDAYVIHYTPRYAALTVSMRDNSFAGPLNTIRPFSRM